MGWHEPLRRERSQGTGVRPQAGSVGVKRADVRISRASVRATQLLVHQPPLLLHQLAPAAASVKKNEKKDKRIGKF